MKSEIAKKFAVYGFKMPSFIIIDKDGKISSKTYLNIADPALVDGLNKASGFTSSNCCSSSTRFNDSTFSYRTTFCK